MCRGSCPPSSSPPSPRDRSFPSRRGLTLERARVRAPLDRDCPVPTPNRLPVTSPYEPSCLTELASEPASLFDRSTVEPHRRTCLRGAHAPPDPVPASRPRSLGRTPAA